MSYLCQICKTHWEVTSFVSEKKHVENYPGFEKLAHVIGAWRGMRISVRSKDAQKQLARTWLFLH